MDDLMLAEIEQHVSRLSVLIPEGKLDFLLGEIKDGPAADKSMQRGYDFVVKLGLIREELRMILT